MYLPQNDREAKKLNEAYRGGKTVKLDGVTYKVTGMTRSIPARYILTPVEGKRGS